MLSKIMLTDPAKHRWMMVTGAPRSGTSYFGDILALDPKVNSIIEPFNPDAGMPDVTQRYMYGVSPGTMSELDRGTLEKLYKYDFKLKTVHSSRDKLAEKVFKTVLFGGNELALLKARFNRGAEYSLIKDPIAVFLVEPLYRMRELDCFFLVRHPLSFVGSLKRLGWNFKVHPLSRNRDLCAMYLPELVDVDPDTLSWTEHAAYIWLAIGRQLEHLKQAEIPIIPVFHEEISADPVAHYRRIYDHLGLEWTPKVSSRITETSTASGKAGAQSGVVHDFFRDASSIFDHSVAQLDPEQIDTIARITKPILDTWYSSADSASLSDYGRDLHMSNIRASG